MGKKQYLGSDLYFTHKNIYFLIGTILVLEFVHFVLFVLYSTWEWNNNVFFFMWCFPLKIIHSRSIYAIAYGRLDLLLVLFFLVSEEVICRIQYSIYIYWITDWLTDWLNVEISAFWMKIWDIYFREVREGVLRLFYNSVNTWPTPNFLKRDFTNSIIFVTPGKQSKSKNIMQIKKPCKWLHNKKIVLFF